MVHARFFLERARDLRFDPKMVALHDREDDGHFALHDDSRRIRSPVNLLVITIDGLVCLALICCSTNQDPGPGEVNNFASSCSVLRSA